MHRRRQSLLQSYQWKLITHANAGDREIPSRNRNGNVICWRNHRRTPAAFKRTRERDQGAPAVGAIHTGKGDSYSPGFATADAETVRRYGTWQGFGKELQEAGNRGAGGGEYVMNDNGLLWVAPLGKIPPLAVPQPLVTGIMALAHSTYGHPGTARTTALISRRYCWPTLIRNVRRQRSLVWVQMSQAVSESTGRHATGEVSATRGSTRSRHPGHGSEVGRRQQSSTGGSRQSQQVLVRLPAPHKRNTRSSEETARSDACFWATAVCSQ